MSSSSTTAASSPTTPELLQFRPAQAPAHGGLTRAAVSLASWDGTDGHDPAEAGPLELIRCSRCQRALSLGLEPAPGRPCGALLDTSSAAGGMVRFGHNLYYCARCASMVGLKR